MHPGVAELDDLATLASALTDRQCWGMQGYWGWYLWRERQRIPPPNPGGFPTPPGGFYSYRQHFRLWASLSPAQRQRALSTAGLPVSELSRLQAAQFVRAFSSVQYEAYLPADRRRTPTGEDLATGVFRVAAGSFYEQEYAGSRSGREEIFRSSRFPDRKTPKGIERHEFDDPEGFAEITWRPIGAVMAVGEYRFQYHLASEEQPARTAAVETVAPGEPA